MTNDMDASSSSVLGYNVRRAYCQHASVATLASSGSSMEEHFSWIKGYARKYPVNGNNIQVIETPSEFYDTLLVSLFCVEVVCIHLYLYTFILIYLKDYFQHHCL